MSSLLAAAPATAWSSGLRGPCLEMKNIILSSSCDSGQQRTTRFAFTMEQVIVYMYICLPPSLFRFHSPYLLARLWIWWIHTHIMCRLLKFG